MNIDRKNRTFIADVLDDYPLDIYEFRVMCRILAIEGNGKDNTSLAAWDAIGINKHCLQFAIDCLREYKLIKGGDFGDPFEAESDTSKWLNPKKVAAKRLELLNS